MPNYSMRDCLTCDDRTTHDGSICLSCINNKFNKLIEYINLHHISLWQDLGEVEEELDSMEDLNSDEYKFKETEHISLSGQIIGVGHILKVAKEFREE